MKKYYRARAVGAELGFAGTGTPQVAVEFELLDSGQHKTWYGFLSDGARDYTFTALRTCGWSTDDLSDLTGLDANEVSVTVEEETYEGKSRERITFINPADGGGIAMKNKMDEAAAKAFAAQMKGAVLAHKQSSGQRLTSSAPKNDGGKEGFAPGGKKRF